MDDNEIFKAWAIFATGVSSALFVGTAYFAGWINSPRVSAVAAAVGVVLLVVTAVAALDGLKDARKARHAALITDLSRRWDEPLIVKSQLAWTITTRVGAEALAVKLFDPNGSTGTPTERETFVELEAAANLIETIGVLEDLGALDLAVVEALWGDAIRSTWLQWEGTVGILRDLVEGPAAQRRRQSSIYQYFEQVAGRLEISAASRR